MAATTPLVKAQLRQVDAEFQNEINPENWTTVQFNPETLKVGFANQIATPSGSGDQNGPASRQFVGAGTTKLSLQLWFDVTAPIPEGALPQGQTQVNDVRKLTQRVAFFITPQKVEGREPKFIPPAVRFLWGTFKFDGIMDSLEESLEFFSGDGRPLRASITISLSQQRITKYQFGEAGSQPPGAGPRAPGTQPLTQAPAGSTVQGLAAAQGRADDWQAIATANGIENPRRLQPGQLINLNVPSPPRIQTGG